jgi:hypothetical protein
MMDLDKLSIKELVELRNEIDERILTYRDGYLYICSVRSYGRVWEEKPKNFNTLQDLCYEYCGDNGIIDVYTNNPNLKFPEMGYSNWGGDTKYIKSEYDYREWVKFRRMENTITSTTQELKEWDERENLPFNMRPNFKPYYSQEDLDKLIQEFENTEWDFVEPVTFDKL